METLLKAAIGAVIGAILVEENERVAAGYAKCKRKLQSLFGSWDESPGDEAGCGLKGESHGAGS